MGLFGNLFKQSKELTHAANAISKVRVLLDQYEVDNDFTNYLCVSAWITRVGFLDLVERNNWYPNFILFVSINGHPSRMTIYEATMQTMGRIKIKTQQLSKYHQKYIDEILDKGDAFFEFEQKLPQEVINMFKK